MKSAGDRRSLSKGVILSGVNMTGLLTDSNLEKSAKRGCRRGKGVNHNLSGKRTDF